MEKTAAKSSKESTENFKDSKTDKKMSNALSEKMTCLVENHHENPKIFGTNELITGDGLLEEYACFKTDNEKERQNSRLENFIESSFSDCSEEVENVEDKSEEIKTEEAFSIFNFAPEDNSAETLLTNDSNLTAKEKETKVEKSSNEEEIFDSVVGKTKNFLSAIVEESFVDNEDDITESKIDNEYEKLLDRLRQERSKSIGSITLDHNNLETTIRNSHSSLNLESLSRRNSEPAGLFSEPENNNYQISDKIDDISMNLEEKAKFCESLDNDDDALFEENIRKNKRVSEVSITEFNEKQSSKKIVYTSSDYENTSESEASTQFVYMERATGCFERLINRVRAIFNL